MAHIKTTHVGSLPRGDELTPLLLARDKGEPYDAAEFDRVVSAAVDEAVRQQVATDPHSPEEFRVNQVVRNVDAYYEAFEVTPEDAAWLDPAQRVTIW